MTRTAAAHEMTEVTTPLTRQRRAFGGKLGKPAKLTIGVGHIPRPHDDFGVQIVNCAKKKPGLLRSQAFSYSDCVRK
jgi:hypothetical protein